MSHTKQCRNVLYCTGTEHMGEDDTEGKAGVRGEYGGAKQMQTCPNGRRCTHPQEEKGEC